MALIAVKRLGHLDTSATSIDGNKVERTATEFYLVRYDAAASAAAAELAAGVPDIGSTSTGDTTRKFKAKNAKMVDESARREWIVQVDFSSHAEEPEENPLDRPDDISWDFEDSSQPYFKDEDPDGSKPVVNTAGQDFEQFLERETGSITATIKRNVAPANYDPAQAITYCHTINNASFVVDGKTIAQGQGKLSGITAGPVQKVTLHGESGDVDVFYREVTFKLKFRRTWSDLIGSRGYAELDATTGELTPILIDTENPEAPPKPTDKPWPLDEDGAAMPNATDAPHELEFFPYTEKDFSVFGFS